MTILDNANDSQNRTVRTLISFAVGLYAWVTTVSLGAVLLDIVYSRLVPEATVAFSKAADLMLLISAVTILVAMGAISLSWNLKVARNLSVASLIVVISGFFAPVFLSPVLGAGSSLGAGIRLVISGLASVLALVAFYELRRNE